MMTTLKMKSGSKKTTVPVYRGRSTTPKKTWLEASPKKSRVETVADQMKTERQVKPKRVRTPRKVLSRSQRATIPIASWDESPSAKIMVYQPLPNGTEAGPFCPVLFPALLSKTYLASDKDDTGKFVQILKKKPAHIRNTTVWIEVIQGDDRNGRGRVVRNETIGLSNSEIPKGTVVRFAGGTAYSSAKVVEILTDLESYKLADYQKA
jgi:hypothetical protein